MSDKVLYNPYHLKNLTVNDRVYFCGDIVLLGNCWVLIKTPFQHSQLVWGIVPLYFGWFMNELTSDRKSYNTAIQSGFSFVWAGLHWSQWYFFHSSGTSIITRNGMLAINFMVILLVLIVGAMAFVSGVRKRYPKHCSFLGHARFANDFMIAIFAIPISISCLDMGSIDCDCRICDPDLVGGAFHIQAAPQSRR